MQKLPKVNPAAAESTNLKLPVKRDAAENVRKLAYSFFEKRGYAHGEDTRDWLRAEKILNRHKHSAGDAAAAGV
jgi:hypothetical protein